MCQFAAGARQLWPPRAALDQHASNCYQLATGVGRSAGCGLAAANPPSEIPAFALACRGCVSRWIYGALACSISLKYRNGSNYRPGQGKGDQPISVHSFRKYSRPPYSSPTKALTALPPPGRGVLPPPLDYTGIGCGSLSGARSRTRGTAPKAGAGMPTNGAACQCNKCYAMQHEIKKSMSCNMRSVRRQPGNTHYKPNPNPGRPASAAHAQKRPISPNHAQAELAESHSNIL